MAGKTTTKNKRKTTPNVDVRLTTKFTKAEKDMIIETAKKRNMKQREFILQSVNAFETRTRKKEQQDSNVINVITSFSNILSDIHAWELKYEKCEEVTELKQTIERRVNETWQYINPN